MEELQQVVSVCLDEIIQLKQEKEQLQQKNRELEQSMAQVVEEQKQVITSVNQCFDNIDTNRHFVNRAIRRWRTDVDDKVSILMDTQNTKELLCRTLDSLWKQSYRAFEVIIVDDCSTDGTLETIQERYGDHENLSERQEYDLLLRLAEAYRAFEIPEVW